MTEHIRNDLLLLYQSLLDGKLPLNLSWNEIVEWIGQIGNVQPHGSDQFAFSVATQRAFFKKPNAHELGVEEVARLRAFLRNAGPLQEVAAYAQPCRMVVAIDQLPPI